MYFWSTVRTSAPMISGAAMMAHNAKWDLASSSDSPGPKWPGVTPTSSMSGSFQCPGRAYEEYPTCLSTLLTTPMLVLSQTFSMSSVVRHMLEVAPQSFWIWSSGLVL